MINVVYRKIKELSANELNPRGPIFIYTLAHELNIRPELISRLLSQLIALKLIKYNGVDKNAVNLTLLGATVSYNYSF